MLDLYTKTSANISEFLNNLGNKLEKLRLKEITRLLELKKEETCCINLIIMGPFTCAFMGSNHGVIN
uniref:Uncharacterized protein n=1 Tax=Schistosoma curassoni TaxID=6186 RepID=A0A183JQL1_9TREM